MKEKAKSILGTVRRIAQRKYFRPLAFDPELNKWQHP